MKAAPDPKKVGPAPKPEPEPEKSFPGFRLLCRVDFNEVEEVFLTSETPGKKLKANRWECPSCGHVWMAHQLIKRAIETEKEGGSS